MSEKKSNRKKITLDGKGKPVDMKKIWENQRKLKNKEREDYEKAVKKERERVDEMECPCCNSTAKLRHHKTESNGVFGPGHHSRTVDDYYICQACGVHYTDLNKK